jgi:predicted nucleic acid-binding protein
MIVSESIFIDTAPFIYLVENNPTYYSRVSNFLIEEFSEKKSIFATSTITLAEFFVKPKLSNDTKTIDVFNSTIKELNISVFDLTKEIAEQSAELRAKYKFLKSFDSIQLATALHFNCSMLFSNDKVFKKINDIKTILVDEI